VGFVLDDTSLPTTQKDYRQAGRRKFFFFLLLAREKETEALWRWKVEAQIRAGISFL